jgi:hypothetical protein
MTVSMLRIKLPTATGPGVIVLEGRLTGLWAQVLLRMARTENQTHGNTFDLKEVTFVDPAGEEALRRLGRAYGASFIAESPYGKYLCKRLKLRRVTVAEAEITNGRVRGCPQAPISYKTKESNKNNVLTCTAVK